MYKNLLVPVDFSETSDNALRYAIRLAQLNQGCIHVLHVNYLPVVDASLPVDVYQGFIEESLHATEESFQRIRNTILEPSGIAYTIESKLGFVVDEINRAAQDANIDLIVMGTLGAHGVEELLIGSNTASLVVRSVKPVLIIPPNVQLESIYRIVYASDFSESNFTLFEPLIDFARMDNAEFDILHIRTTQEKSLLNYEYIIDNYRNGIGYDKLSFHETENDNILEAIDQYIAQQKTQLVVLSRHKRNFFERLFHRSISKRMAYHTHVPMLVLVQ